MTTRERLARAAMCRIDELGEGEHPPQPPVIFWGEVVDAILNEMHEPSEEMIREVSRGRHVIDAEYTTFTRGEVRGVWESMIDAILEGK